MEIFKDQKHSLAFCLQFPILIYFYYNINEKLKLNEKFKKIDIKYIFGIG